MTKIASRGSCLEASGFKNKIKNLSMMFSDGGQFVGGHRLLNTFSGFQNFSQRYLIISFFLLDSHFKNLSNEENRITTCQQMAKIIAWVYADSVTIPTNQPRKGAPGGGRGGGNLQQENLVPPRWWKAVLLSLLLFLILRKKSQKNSGSF